MRSLNQTIKNEYNSRTFGALTFPYNNCTKLGQKLVSIFETMGKKIVCQRLKRLKDLYPFGQQHTNGRHLPLNQSNEGTTCTYYVAADDPGDLREKVRQQEEQFAASSWNTCDA